MAKDPFRAIRIYSSRNVFEAALDRVRWLFDEFENVVVGFSGGKDSTVVFNLAMMVAREKKRLPLQVLFLDQEAEWQATVDQVRLVMEDPDVKPMWMQVPLRLFNATSSTEHWLNCWAPDEEERWMRPRESYSYKENVYGTDRFAGLFDRILYHHFPDVSTVSIAGVRCEESPSRAMGLTHYPSYKWATWGAVTDRPPREKGKPAPQAQHRRMYPIYDWSYTDVWAAIHKNGWHYNAIYDAQYAHGVPVTKMRVSNVHHETAVGALFYMQEVEPETYERLTQRIGGIDTAGKMGLRDYFPKQLPPMFGSWREYRDYLVEKLIANPEWKVSFAKEFAATDARYGDDFGDALTKIQITSVLTNDWEFIKIKNYVDNPQFRVARLRQRGEAMWGDA